MSGWIKIGVEFVKALPGQWKGSCDPNACSETANTMAEEAPGADSIAVRLESQISIKLPMASGDAINPVLAAAGYNFRRLLACLRLLLLRILIAFSLPTQLKSSEIGFFTAD
jgi:hypothetical protein